MARVGFSLKVDSEHSKGFGCSQGTDKTDHSFRHMLSRPVGKGGGWGASAPQFLADQLTLSQPGGGGHYPHTALQAPPDFQTLRRPCEENTGAFTKRCIGRNKRLHRGRKVQTLDTQRLNTRTTK